jgi:transmembrane sensor
MNPLQNQNFPWKLVSGSFSGGLLPEEELQLQQWLASDADNMEQYHKLRDIWENSTEDYRLYLMANEVKAWNALHARLKQAKETKYIKLSTYKVLQVAAAIAVVVALSGIGYWLSTKSNAPTYETALNEQRQVKLDDGTAVSLYPSTKIEVSKNFNTKNRTVRLTEGEASFAIQHQKNFPFIVDMGSVHVKDIGTVFNIKRSKKQIDVTVVSGKVIFTRQSAEESKELTTGMSLSYNVTNDSFVEIQHKPALHDSIIHLSFDNTPLTEVLRQVQLKYGKTITLEKESIGKKKITAQLDDMPYPTVVEIICKSLNLEYTETGNTCVLKDKSH